MSKEAALAAWEALESSGLRLLENSGVLGGPGPVHTIRAYIEDGAKQRLAIGMQIRDGRIYSTIVIEPSGAPAFGVYEQPATPAGAEASVARILKFLTTGT